MIKLIDLYDASRLPCILFDGTKITSDFIKTYGYAEVDMFTFDWRTMSCVIFPTGAYTEEDRKRWDV